MEHASTPGEVRAVPRSRMGMVLSGIAVAFLLFDIVGKLLMVPPVVAGSLELGYPVTTVRTLGVILLACLVTYVIPRLSVLGRSCSPATSAELSPRSCASAIHCSRTSCFPCTWSRSCGAVCCWARRPAVASGPPAAFD
jgi:hypothetical protein